MNRINNVLGGRFVGGQRTTNSRSAATERREGNVVELFFVLEPSNRQRVPPRNGIIQVDERGHSDEDDATVCMTSVCICRFA